MSRLTDLIAQAKAKDPQMGADLEQEFQSISSRLPFGLNFERHRPEVVELPERLVRKGDKVRILPERGSLKKGDPALWRVSAFTKHGKERLAHLEPIGAPEPRANTTINVTELVVVAEFRDTIYPGLKRTGGVSRGGDKPCHTVINGENYHVLKALTWTHRGKVDAIYIDPPYNTGAKDWKYNNDYVEGDDLYRHSKWLAMMERRLKVAKELLNPADSVLIVTIDEKEFLRLGLLLEQIFPEARIQMVSSVINPGSSGRFNEFSRTDEYIFFVMFGSYRISGEGRDGTASETVYWRAFQRANLASVRGRTGKGACGPRQFYPIYVNSETGAIAAVGEPIPPTMDISKVPDRPGCDTVWPIRPDGTHMNWNLTPEPFAERVRAGFVRVGARQPRKPQKWPVYYLSNGIIKAIEAGTAIVEGRGRQGEVIARNIEESIRMPTTNWQRESHNARTGGTEVVVPLLGGRRFPFPKSLYAVEDALRFFVAKKSAAVVVDFFAGSGTTAHAVMRLNKQDGGRRQCISVTNNEVGADEQKKLRQQGLRPGDADWEQWGICDYITKPRVRAAITGKTPEGQPIKGEYKFTDIFPMADGFEENAEFFTLTYEAPMAVSYQTAFAHIAPLLWLRAGSRGRCIDKVPVAGWEVAEAYGLLVDLDFTAQFLKDLRNADDARVAYIVTDDERRFQTIARRLPEGVEPVRLYESYLTNFGFANGDEA